MNLFFRITAGYSTELIALSFKKKDDKISQLLTNNKIQNTTSIELPF